MFGKITYQGRQELMSHFIQSPNTLGEMQIPIVPFLFPQGIPSRRHERCRASTCPIPHLLAVFERPALQWTDVSEMSSLSQGAMAWKSNSCPSTLQLHPALVTRLYLARLI